MGEYVDHFGVQNSFQNMIPNPHENTKLPQGGICHK